MKYLNYSTYFLELTPALACSRAGVGASSAARCFQTHCRSMVCPRNPKRTWTLWPRCNCNQHKSGSVSGTFRKKDWVVEWFNALVTTFVAPSACSDSAWQQVRTFMLRSAHVWPFAFLDAERPKGTMLSCPAPGILSYSHGYATAPSRRILWWRSK